MSKASTLLDSWLVSGGFDNRTVRCFALNHLQAVSLDHALAEDALDYLHSASVTLASSLRCIHGRHFTWATIALYYSVFLCLRAFAAHKALAICHLRRKPLAIQAVAGMCPVQQRGTTHEATARQFRNLAPGHVLFAQTIDGDDPIDWMRGQREFANYRVSRYPDPLAPDIFKQCTKYGMRRLIGTYLSEDLGLYAFDSDHAIVAYPLFVYDRVVKEFRQVGREISIDRRFIAESSSDETGPIAVLVEHLAGRRN